MKKKIEYPAMNVQLVSIHLIEANDYNPNKMASPELNLLAHSIEQDGVTQPLVCYEDLARKKYILVDGFHRYLVLKKNFKARYAPVVVIKKSIGDRMASTIRHNRAKGVHEIDRMVSLIHYLHQEGWGDEKISKELGMEKEEVFRLKQKLGLKELFLNHEFSHSWATFEEKYYS